jgi:hypothetical protein
MVDKPSSGAAPEEATGLSAREKKPSVGSNGKEVPDIKKKCKKHVL